MLHLTDDVDVPRLDIRGLVFEAFERDTELDLVAVIGQSALRYEDEVLAQVGRGTSSERRRPSAPGRGARLDDRAIHLDAKRIDGEHVRLTPVVKRAKQDLDVVIGAD